MHQCGLCGHALTVCPSVCLSRSWIISKRINISSKFFHYRVAKPFWFFRAKRNGDIPTGTPITGASNAGGVGKKAILDEYLASLHTGLQCYQPYESRSVKNKAATNRGKRRAEHSVRRPSSVVRTRRRRSVCDGFDVIRLRRKSTPPPRTQPPWSLPSKVKIYDLWANLKKLQENVV